MSDVVGDWPSAEEHVVTGGPVVESDECEDERTVVTDGGNGSVSTHEISEPEDVREFTDRLAVEIHNRWIRERDPKPLGSTSHQPVRLVCKWRFEEVDDAE